MNTYIALFRGINVGSTRSLPMKELVAALEELGCRHVKTYIQSGNVVFQSDDTDAVQLATGIGEEIQKRRGFQPQVLLLSAEEFEKAAAQNPFPEAQGDPRSLHLGFLISTSENPDLAALEQLAENGERFRLIEKVFYLHVPAGVGRSKLAANTEKLLGVAVTDRNWRTVSKIIEMVRERSGS